MKLLMFSIVALFLVSCSQDDGANSKSRRNAERNIRVQQSNSEVEVVDSALIQEIVEELQYCTDSGRLYEFSDLPGQKGLCTETLLLDIDCTREGLQTTSDITKAQADLFALVIEERWDEINAPTEIKERLEGISTHEIYGCTGRLDNIIVHTYKVDLSTGEVAKKEVNLKVK